MELGGNAPFLVFDDADIDAAVDGAMIAKMRNIGEACIAANRFHVPGSVAEEFTDKLAARMGALTIGRGTEDGVDVGPLIDDNQRQKVAELVDDAIDTRRHAPSSAATPATAPGYFYRADGAHRRARRRRAAARGDLRPGGADRDLRRRGRGDGRRQRHRVRPGRLRLHQQPQARAARRRGLEIGMVGLNRGMVSNAAAPFGGVKQSGFGREGGHEGIEEYLETKYVAVDL